MKKDIKEFLEYMAIAGVAIAIVMHLQSIFTSKLGSSDTNKTPKEQVDSVNLLKQQAVFKQIQKNK